MSDVTGDVVIRVIVGGKVVERIRACSPARGPWPSGVNSAGRYDRSDGAFVALATSSAGQSRSTSTSENFQRFTPSSRFTEWAAARELSKTPQGGGKPQTAQTVSKPETVEKAPFVDGQSGS